MPCGLYSLYFVCLLFIQIGFHFFPSLSEALLFLMLGWILWVLLCNNTAVVLFGVFALSFPFFVFCAWQHFQLQDSQKLNFSVIEVGFGFPAFGLDRENIVDDGRLVHVINGSDIEFLSVYHRQDLPVAPSVFGDAPVVRASVKLVVLVLHEAIWLDRELRAITQHQLFHGDEVFAQAIFLSEVFIHFIPVLSLVCWEILFNFGVEVFCGVDVILTLLVFLLIFFDHGQKVVKATVEPFLVHLLLLVDTPRLEWVSLFILLHDRLQVVLKWHLVSLLVLIQLWVRSSTVAVIS